MVISIQSSVWPDALQARLDTKASRCAQPHRFNLSGLSWHSPHGPPNVSQHGRYYDLTSSLYTSYHHL